MDLHHIFSPPLHANPCSLDPCTNIHFIAIPISKTTIGLWRISELSDKKSSHMPIELNGHSKVIQALEFANASKYLLASSCSDKILLWDLDFCENKPTWQPFFSKPGNINVMCFNNNDNIIAAGRDSVIVLFEKEKSGLKAILEAHDTFITNVKFCPHYSATLVSISDDRTICVWDIDKLVLLYRSCIISSSPLLSLAMNLYEPHVAIGSADGHLRIFDLTDGHDFRQLGSLDVANKIKRNNLVVAEAEIGNKTTPAVVSKKNKSAQSVPISNPSDNFVESSESLLHIEYVYGGQNQCVSNFLPNIHGQYSGAGDLINNIPPSMCIISTNSLVELNSRTLEINSISNLQTPIRNSTFAHSLTVGPLSYAACTQINPFQVIIAVGTLFERKMHVLDCALMNDKFQTIQSFTGEEDCDNSIAGSNASDEDNLNIVAICGLIDNSPLKAEMLPPVMKSVTTRGDVAVGKKKVTSTMNQPLTFKSKIQSSGYTKAPRTTMFKPETSKQKLLNLSSPSIMKTSKKGTAGAMKMLTAEYDSTKGPANELCDTFEVDNSLTAVLNLRFSDDGGNLGCALSNKTGLSIKSPFSKHICTSFIGHNNQVNSVFWSNSNNFILTSSNDKTVALWDKSGGDALMIMSHQRGSPKEKDKQNNVSTNSTLRSKSKSIGHGLSPVSSADNKQFVKEIKYAQFFYMDKFILMIHGGDLALFKYHISSEIDDLKRYQTRNRYKLVETWQGESTSFTSMAAINNFYSHLVLCTTTGKAVEVYDVNKSTKCHTFSACHSRPPHCVSINGGSSFSSQSSQAYNIFATAAPTDPIKLWDVRSKSCIQTLTGHLNNSHSCQIAFSPCGNYLASGSEDRCAYIFDLRKGTFCEKLRGHNEVVCSVAFHPAYPLLATGCLDSKIILYKSS